MVAANTCGYKLTRLSLSRSVRLPVDTGVCADFLPVHREVPHVPNLHRLVVTGGENHVSGCEHCCVDGAAKDEDRTRELEINTLF